MIEGWSVLWSLVPNLVLCVILLLVLRRQTAAHTLAIIKLEALKRSLDALDVTYDIVDSSAPCSAQHDVISKAETRV